MVHKKIPEQLKAYTIKTVKSLINRSAGYVTDVHTKKQISTSAHPLPIEATKIKFRTVKSDKQNFEWTNWFLIKK